MTLAEQIKIDLVKRLRAEGLTRADLGLERLARHYGTSTRPVRQALADLRGSGAFKAVATTQKLRSKQPVAFRIPLSDVAQAEKEALFKHISNELIRRNLIGEEEFIRESATADEFGVSTTVIRELFSKLVGQGILQHVPRRGWRLKPLTQKDLDDFIEARDAMEVRALRLAWDRLDIDRMKCFLRANRVSSSGETSIDNAFHREIIATADNRYISDFADRHGAYFAMIFEWESSDEEAGRRTVRQHRRILSAIVSRDLPRAERALSHHIRYNHPALKSLLRGMPG